MASTYLGAIPACSLLLENIGRQTACMELDDCLVRIEMAGLIYMWRLGTIGGPLGGSVEATHVGTGQDSKQRHLSVRQVQNLYYLSRSPSISSQIYPTGASNCSSSFQRLQ